MNHREKQYIVYKQAGDHYAPFTEGCKVMCASAMGVSPGTFEKILSNPGASDKFKISFKATPAVIDPNKVNACRQWDKFVAGARKILGLPPLEGGDEMDLASEYSAEFDRLRRNRVEVAFYKYGPARKNFGEGRVDALKTAELCLDAFKRDGNTEHLADAANYLMFRYMFPMDGEGFRATDSSESVGTVGTPVNMEGGYG